MPRRARAALPAIQAKSPLPLQIRGVCVACGGRNLIRLAPQSAQVQCRCCGVVSPDFTKQKAPSGYAGDVGPELLDKHQAHVMVDEILSALSQESVRTKMQKLLGRAWGDVALICHFYVPFVLDVWQMVVAKYGFCATTEGVKASLHQLQTHATAENDGQLTAKLILLRRVLTPTGEWIQQDQDADADELRKMTEDEENQRRQRAEDIRLEQIAAENAMKARLRAKKVALGLDPSVPRLPVVDCEPPRAVVVHASARFQLRVVARYTQQFQWFLNGKPLTDAPHVGGEALFSGAQRSMLTVARLTKRTEGDYYCVCTNEEGVVASRPTSVQATALRSQRLATRNLKAKPSCELVQVTMATTPEPTSVSTLSLVALCCNGKLHLLHTATLEPVKTLPPLTHPTDRTSTAVAWLPRSKLLVVALRSSYSELKPCELMLFSLSTPTASAGGPPQASSPHSTNAAKQSTKPPPGLNATQVARGNVQLPPPPQLLSRHLATHQLPAQLRTVETLRFLDAGRTLLVWDGRAVVLVYELSQSSLVCKGSLHYDHPRHFICHVATADESVLSSIGGASVKDAFTGFALCFRDCARVELVDSTSTRSQKLQFSFPVRRAAIDQAGSYLAAAETGCLKTWISIFAIAVDTPRTGSVANLNRRRFVAHVGKISGMAWTTTSALLVTSGHDGYVKMWEVERGTERNPPCVFQIHLDFRGIHSLAIRERIDSVGFLALGFSNCCLHSREIPQLLAFEETRHEDRNRAASQIQKIVKGRLTRELIAKFIKPKI